MNFCSSHYELTWWFDVVALGNGLHQICESTWPFHLKYATNVNQWIVFFSIFRTFTFWPHTFFNGRKYIRYFSVLNNFTMIKIFRSLFNLRMMTLILIIEINCRPLSNISKETFCVAFYIFSFIFHNQSLIKHWIGQ